jgi:hypothetical protein
MDEFTEVLKKTLADWQEWAAPTDDRIDSAASYVVTQFVELLVNNLKSESDG